jgi:hypothetical protein
VPNVFEVPNVSCISQTGRLEPARRLSLNELCGIDAWRNCRTEVSAALLPLGSVRSVPGSLQPARFWTLAPCCLAATGMASDADTMNIPQNRKFKCWAAACGGCGEGPSAEHIVSKCLFPEGVVHVSGFDWCKGETKSIGVNGLERQILCKTHNSALSGTDAEAKKAVGLFQRSTPSTKDDPLGDSNIDGHKLERWLFKTAINLSCHSGLHIGVSIDGSVPGLPSPYLIDVAFGKPHFSAQMGAYFLFPAKETLHQPREIVMIPLIKDGHIGGYYFELRSRAVFLNLFPGHVPPTLGTVASKLELQQGLLDAELVYRPPSIAKASNSLLLSKIRFKW